MITVISTLSADETRSVAAVIGRALGGRICFLLSGDYGAGKTTFVQGLATGLQIQGPVRSPSYNILKKYDTGKQALVHVDLYRTSGSAEVSELGIDEMLPGDGVLAIEWPGSFPAADFGFPVVGIHFSPAPGVLPGGDNDEQRTLEVTWEEDVPIALIEVLRAFAA